MISISHPKVFSFVRKVLSMQFLIRKDTEKKGTKQRYSFHDIQSPEKYLNVRKEIQNTKWFVHFQACCGLAGHKH